MWGPEEIIAIALLEAESVFVMLAAVILEIQAPTVKDEITTLAFVDQWAWAEGVLGGGVYIFRYKVV